VLVPVLAGPTATGKTSLVTALASLADIEIVAADSRQVYRRLNIGTAKPSPEERSAAPYHGLDLVEPWERYSAGRFGREAKQWIADIRSRGRVPVLVGGTGFYIRALFEGLFAEPPLEPGRRERLRVILGRMPTPALLRWAARLDPAFRRRDRQRGMRAVEVALLTGQPLTRWHERASASGHGLKPWYAVLALPRPLLAARIASRTRAMLEAGLVDEVRDLLREGIAPHAAGFSGVGYREVVRHLLGGLPAEGLAAAIELSTRRYAKRQETWFRHQLKGPVMVLDATLDAVTLAHRLLAGYRAAAR
jgi:tRNA dimethylallyltransferase